MDFKERSSTEVFPSFFLFGPKFGTAIYPQRLVFTLTYDLPQQPRHQGFAQFHDPQMYNGYIQMSIHIGGWNH